MAGKRHRSGNSAVISDRRRRRRGVGRSDGSEATLTIINGCFAGLKIPLKKDRTTLGSAVSCDICLDHSFVADEHAVILKTGDGFVLEDLNSRHGTSVNGSEIHRRILSAGDRIGIGTFELKFSG